MQVDATAKQRRKNEAFNCPVVVFFTNRRSLRLDWKLGFFLILELRVGRPWMLLGSKRTSFETKWPSSIRHLLLKEDIRKAEGFAKASMKNYDNRTEELKVLKALLKEAESNFRETERELMIINPKELTEEVTSETAVTGLVLDKFCR
ncbi:unnamed protein product [Rhodiola kirilowii]